MGDQKKARAQYLVAIKGTKERPTQVNYRILWAMTYYRENKPVLAHRHFYRLIRKRIWQACRFRKLKFIAPWRFSIPIPRLP